MKCLLKGRGEIRKDEVLRATVDGGRESLCGSAGGWLRSLLVNWCLGGQQMVLFIDERPGNERHPPVNKGKHSPLTDIPQSIVPRDRLHVKKDRGLSQRKEKKYLYKDIDNNIVLE